MLKRRFFHVCSLNWTYLTSLYVRVMENHGKPPGSLENKDINHPKNISNQHNPIIKRWVKNDPLPIRGSFASDVRKSPASPHHCRWSRWVPSWWPPLRVSWPMTPVVFPRHAPNHLPSSCFSQVSSVCFWCSLDPTSFQQHFNHKNSSSSMDPYGPARFQAAPHGMSHHLLDDSPVMLQPLRRRWGIAQIRACAPEGLDGTAGAAKV